MSHLHITDKNKTIRRNYTIVASDTIRSQHKKQGTFRLDLRKISGKPFAELSPRHAGRKLGQLKFYAKQALWFAEGFGLMPTTLLVETINSHQPVTLDLQESTPPPSDDKRIKLLQVNQLMHNDEFCFNIYDYIKY